MKTVYQTKFYVYIYIFLCLMAFNSSNVNACSSEKIISIQDEIYQGRLVDNKLYIHPSQIIISKEGLFLLINN